MQQQQTACKASNDILSPQLPPAPLQQTIPLPDVASDCEGPSAPKKPASSQPIVTSQETSHDAEIAEVNVAARLTPSNSRDIHLNDCINIDNSNKTPNVYINGLPPHFPEEQLYALAAPYGPIRSVRTFTRHVKESESGYGFVLYVSL
jgi:RNA recognition motif-containing protein